MNMSDLSFGAFTSYKKGGNKKPLKGTRPSVHNSQIQISTGIPSLDANLGKVIGKIHL